MTSMTRRTFAAAMAVGTVAAAAGMAGCSQQEEAAEPQAEDAAQEPEAAEPEAASYDLIVVGAGAAGLIGAAKAAADGASVLVLESEGATGGTTATCGTHYTNASADFMANLPDAEGPSDFGPGSDAAYEAFLEIDPSAYGDFQGEIETAQQQVAEYLAAPHDKYFWSVEYWIAQHAVNTMGDHMISGVGVDLDGNGPREDHDAVVPAYYNQDEPYDFMKTGGITWDDERDNDPAGGPISVVAQYDGGAEGPALIKGLSAMVEGNGGTIQTGAKVTELVVDDAGAVTGVVANGAEYAAKSVLLATGGFGSNADLVRASDNCFTGVMNASELYSAEGGGCDGTAMQAAQEIGADVSNLAFVQYFPFPIGLPTVFGAIQACMMGGTKMAVNKEGVRFADDGNTFRLGPVAVASTSQTDAQYFLVGDGEGYAQITTPGEQGDALYDTLGRLADGFFEGETLEEVAAAAGITDTAALAAEVEKFNGFVAAGKDDDFGREQFAGAIGDGPYYIIKLANYVQNTMGGLVIDETGHVLDVSGQAIPGLFAAGEAVGNLDGAYRRHGDNFAHIFWYGYLAGKTAAAQA